MMVVCGHLLQRVERFYDDTFLSDFEKNLFAILATPFSGCCIFFCVSGYSLMLFLHSKLRTIDRSVIFLYIERRILRLYPPYFIIISLTYLYVVITHYTPVGTNQFFVRPNSLTVSLLASLSLAHDLIFGTFPRMFPPGWFVETQCQFYVIGPLIWVLYLKLPAGSIRLNIGIIFLVICSAVSVLIEHNELRHVAYSVINFMPYFWMGALLADLQLSAKAGSPNCAPRNSWSIGWCGLAALILLGKPLDSAILELTARIVCLVIVFRAALVVGTTFQRLLVSRWLTRVGVACYSIYLVHLQILQIMTPMIVHTFERTSMLLVIAICGVCGLSIVAAISAVFYWLIERPCVAATRLISLPDWGFFRERLSRTSL
jgi:peptidoglycan/LPS O-acetylase OafA/YrhL